MGTSGCFDWDAYEPGQATGGTGGAAGTGGQGLAGGSGGTGGGTGGTGGGEPSCTGDTFECLPDGSARECVGGTWQSLGSCPLGCNAGVRECQVPSNVDPESVGEGDGDVSVAAGGDDTVFNTDTGEIRAGTSVIRPAGEGLDAGSGIAFSIQAQGAGEPGLGVFSMGSLTVADAAVLRGEGDNALVLAVEGNAQIDGLVSVVAEGAEAGPGGFDGGAAGADGTGPCPGIMGTGHAIGHYCTSGGGGAGRGATGGSGGNCTCTAPDDFAGGDGGQVCGTPELIPLVGGSSGAGGTPAASAIDPPTQPGVGGGGGGALQITAAGTITVSGTGGINAGGGGGGESISAGGTGGGAGGAVLLEAPVVTVATGAILAANGGGGGGGDCT